MRWQRTARIRGADAKCLTFRDRPGGLSSMTSAGEAVPVPFFMMVMAATRLPKRAACSGSPVTRKAIAAPAVKLSPAPQISTGLATGSRCDPLFAAVVDHQRALASVRHDQAARPACGGAAPRSRCVRRARRDAASASCWLGFTTAWRKCSARSGNRPRSTVSRMSEREARDGIAHGGVTTPPCAGLGLIGDQDHVVVGRGAFQARDQFALHRFRQRTACRRNRRAAGLRRRSAR